MCNFIKTHFVCGTTSEAFVLCQLWHADANRCESVPDFQPDPEPVGIPGPISDAPAPGPNTVATLTTIAVEIHPFTKQTQQQITEAGSTKKGNNRTAATTNHKSNSLASKKRKLDSKRMVSDDTDVPAPECYTTFTKVQSYEYCNICENCIKLGKTSQSSLNDELTQLALIELGFPGLEATHTEVVRLAKAGHPLVPLAEVRASQAEICQIPGVRPGSSLLPPLVADEPVAPAPAWTGENGEPDPVKWDEWLNMDLFDN